MKLSDLNLNRFLYKDVKDLETPDSSVMASNIRPEEVVGISSGDAVYDINSSSQFIKGSNLDPNSPIPSTALNIADLGWTNTCVFSVSNATTVTWGAGVFTSANGNQYNISAGTTGVMSAKTYVYLDINVSTTSYQTTTNVNAPLGVGRVLIAVCQNATVSATYALVQTTQISGDNIIANSINASKITAGSITATQISSAYVYAGTINADQINAGTLTGFTIQTRSSGHRVVIDGNNDDVLFYNANGDVTIYLDGSKTDTTDSQMRVGGSIFLSSSTSALGVYGTGIGSFGFGGTGIISLIEAVGNGSSCTIGIRSDGQFWHYGTHDSPVIIFSNSGSIYANGDISGNSFTLDSDTIYSWADVGDYISLTDYMPKSGGTFTGNVSVGSNTFRVGGYCYLNSSGTNAWIYSTGSAIQLGSGGSEVLNANSSRTNIQSALYINGTQVVSTRKSSISSPSADVASLKTAVDTIISRLASHGLISS